MTDLVGVVLAAGAGERLNPLSRLRPKPLCPVGNVALIDHALARLDGLVDAVAVNLHHRPEMIDAHLPATVHRSHEIDRALGTAGALGHLRSWTRGRDVLVTNSDAWLDDFAPGQPAQTSFVQDWDRERVRLLCVRDRLRGDFGDLRYCGVALMPGASVDALSDEPSGLYEVSWRAEAEAGRLDLVVHDGVFVDCGTPADYLRANLEASGGTAVVHPTAEVGPGARIERSVVWDHSRVASGEVLVDAIRAESLTVLIR